MVLGRSNDARLDAEYEGFESSLPMLKSSDGLGICFLLSRPLLSEMHFATPIGLTGECVQQRRLLNEITFQQSSLTSVSYRNFNR